VTLALKRTGSRSDPCGGGRHQTLGLACLPEAPSSQSKRRHSWCLQALRTCKGGITACLLGDPFNREHARALPSSPSWLLQMRTHVDSSDSHRGAWEHKLHRPQTHLVCGSHPALEGGGGPSSHRRSWHPSEPLATPAQGGPLLVGPDTKAVGRCRLLSLLGMGGNAGTESPSRCCLLVLCTFAGLAGATADVHCFDVTTKTWSK